MGNCDKYGFAFLMFSGARDVGDEPYHSSSARFSWEPREADILAQLRELGGGRLAGSSAYMKPLRDIRHRTPFDAVVKVLWAGSLPGVALPVVFVWDGTDAWPYPSRRVDFSNCVSRMM
jgi:hypothetical protein